MIPSVRIKNDINIDFDVFRNDQPENFADASEIIVILKGKYGEVITPEFKIEGNKISVLAKAEQQSICDKYTLFVSYKKPNSERFPELQLFTVDVEAFELVDKSSKAVAGTNSNNLTVSTIKLNGVIAVNESGVQGLSAYQVWTLEQGNEGKTKAEYYAFLQLPAKDFVEAIVFEYSEGKLNITY